MQEMGQILDLAQEIYLDRELSRTGAGSSALNPIPIDPLPSRPRSPALELSAIEQGVLEALSDQLDIQEDELVKILTEKGFAGTLIEGIIADLARKMGTSGGPMLEVRYSHGQYSYRLRPQVASHLIGQ
jgi:hypothetical protein